VDELEADPEDAVRVLDVRAFHRAPEDGELMAQRRVLQGKSVTVLGERPKQAHELDEGSHHLILPARP